MALMQLSAVLKAGGHSCEVVLAPDAKRAPLEQIERAEPDIIGFSVMTPQREWALEVAATLRCAGTRALLIAGGPHPTFFPEFLEEGDFDMINIGEGEGALLELADRLRDGKDLRGIRNLHQRVGGEIHKAPLRPLAELDELPDPDRELYMRFPEYRQSSGRYAYVSKGCPYGCAFCFIPRLRELYKDDPRRGRFRLKSVDRCISELLALKRTLRVGLITFLDSTFNGDRAWTLEFLRRYACEVRIPFTVNLRAELLDEETAGALAASGCCDHVRMGVETGDEDYRRRMLGKQTSDAQFLRAARLLRGRGIRFLTYNMFGLPNESFAQACRTLEFNQELKPDFFVPLVFQALPGLELTRRAVESGVLGEGAAPRAKGRSELLYSRLRQPEIDETVNLCKLSIAGLRLPGAAPLARRLAKLRPNRLFDAAFMLGLGLQARRMYGLDWGQTRRFIRDYFSP